MAFEITRSKFYGLTHRQAWHTLLVLIGAGWFFASGETATAQLMISGNETKIDLHTGAARAIEPEQEDSISIIDFSTWPPEARHVEGIPNTVIGPPSNVALFADGRRALVANSLKMNPAAKPDPWEPATSLQLVDLEADPPRVIQTIAVGKQPSGLSFVPGKPLVLIANRAGGSVSVVRVTESSLELLQEVKVADSELSVSDVAVHPDGASALVSVQKGGFLAELKIEGEQVSNTGHQISVCGQPYRVVITPDGAMGLTAGQGHAANGVDIDAVTVVDLRERPYRAIDYVNVGSIVESIEISPDGQWLATALMAGSSFTEDDPRHREHGQMSILRREGMSFRLVQTLDVGRIPEGVAFTSDSKHLAIQCHPARSIWVFRMTGDGAVDTGHRIETPGFPSSLRSESTVRGVDQRID